ncbi:FAD binding domain-containing protein [Hymenobacter swuensis]|uniref:Xanthine dehydrogenase, iron-sulfur cluster and FAD-binding subunit n=1 Tax=Hymenobacter swuensis DY53 TaxID=1227739 RepID=W8EV01_9BACT|nr:FAD binding domain-containing protein [Hymenobacter swuensis]AHJ96368.1 Xanthine dehydrogenase, iron-sulfur cluster and FAD-binding subunit [Hymenobacter swuensis DY53]
MLQFYLNNQLIRTDQPAGSTLLDFVRYHQHLKGTKIGCREGDCGACTVLVGELDAAGAMVQYQAMTSCLTPLGNAHGKHVVTVEGINAARGTLTPVQQAIVQEGGSQCGFCTVGFVMSLTGHALSEKTSTPTSALASIDGNICRCTGYKSLERAAQHLTAQLQQRPAAAAVSWLAAEGFVPPYFADMPARLTALHEAARAAATGGSEATNPVVAPVPVLDAPAAAQARILGGGTDLLVQQPEQLRATPVQLLYNQPQLRGIRREGNLVILGGTTTAQQLLESEVLLAVLPQLPRYLKLVSSTPIRQMGTVAGNFINASPIGDLTILFLALGAEIGLSTVAGQHRTLPLAELYLGYKQLTKTADEQVTEIRFEAPTATDAFNFEKVSKRTHLDIASVNTAAWLRVDNGVIREARLSAGGVGPIPLLLRQTAAALVGRPVSLETVRLAQQLAQQEISPISDVRGTEHYKRLLLHQLLEAHFVETGLLIEEQL